MPEDISRLVDVDHALLQSEGRIPSWHSEAAKAVLAVVKQSGGRETPGKGSFYLDMKARRIKGELDFDRSKLQLSLRHSWCALTVCFWEARNLMDSLEQLPASLRDEMVSWFWMGREPQHLHAGYPTASTCVVVLGGVRPSLSVSRVVSLLVRDLKGPVEEWPTVADMECAPGWFIQAFDDLEDVLFWLHRHKSVLEGAYVSVEVLPGDCIVFPLNDSEEWESASCCNNGVNSVRCPLGEVSSRSISVNHL